MTTPVRNIDLPMDRLREFCERWGIVRLALFGSVLRDDFGPDSDVDLLAWFAAGRRMSLFDHVEMELELSTLLGRRAEIVHRDALDEDHNVRRSSAIKESARDVYRAR